MSSNSLQIRCALAIAFLEKYITFKAENDEEFTTEWYKANLEIIELKLKPAQQLLSNGHDVYNKALRRPVGERAKYTGKDNHFFDKGQPILPFLQCIEATIVDYKTFDPITASWTFEVDAEVLMDIKKRARSEELSVKSSSPRKRRRVDSVAHFFEGDDEDDEPVISPVSSSPVRRSPRDISSTQLSPSNASSPAEPLFEDQHVGLEEPDLEPEQEQEHDQVIKLSIEDADDGDDDLEAQLLAAFEEDEEEEEDFLMSGALQAPASLAALAATNNAPKKRRGRPPKIDTNLANLEGENNGYSPGRRTHRTPRTDTPRTSTPRLTASPSLPGSPPASSSPASAGGRRRGKKKSPNDDRPKDALVWPPLTYNGRRGRPKDMPNVLCPEGINPRVWYGMSYRCQLERLDGLKLLGAMDSESEDYGATTDEEEGY